MSKNLVDEFDEFFGNVCPLEPRCIGHPPSRWLGSAVIGLGPAPHARILGSTTEQWGVGQHERFSPRLRLSQTLFHTIFQLFFNSKTLNSSKTINFQQILFEKNLSNDWDPCILDWVPELEAVQDLDACISPLPNITKHPKWTETCLFYHVLLVLFVCFLKCPIYSS